jgi:hypothetical protein
MEGFSCDQHYCKSYNKRKENIKMLPSMKKLPEINFQDFQEASTLLLQVLAIMNFKINHQSYPIPKLLNVFTSIIIDDNLNVSKHIESEAVLIFILVPRKDIIPQLKCQQKDLYAMTVNLNKCNNMKNCWRKCTGVLSKYASMGVHCNRNSLSLSNTIIQQDCIHAYKRVNKILHRECT